MSIPRLTEERLRTYVQAQSDRERLCQGLMALDGRFRDVRPRRPKGGPDGSRDLEAVARANGKVVWGAVGFRSQVSDSPEDKAEIKKKFKADLAAALAENPGLYGLVFFTNVDLTPGEVDALEKAGREAGLTLIDIVHRERMRIALDSANGFALRFQYLGVPLTEAEQATFFNEWGDRIHETLVARFASVQSGIRRLEFLQDRMLPLSSYSLQMWFDGTPKEQLGAFRVSFKVMSTRLIEDEDQGLWVAFRNDPSAPQGLRGQVCSPVSRCLKLNQFSFGSCALGVSGFMSAVGSFATLAELHDAIVFLCVNKAFAPKLTGARLVLNQYQVLTLQAGELKTAPVPPEAGILWPKNSGDETELEADPWVYIRPKNLNDEAPWLLDLGAPRKLLTHFE